MTATAVDQARLLAAVLEAVPPGSRVASGAGASISRAAGGASGLTYIVEPAVATSRDRVVVRVAPPGLAPTGGRDVLRQAALLRALSGTGVPVPRVLATWPGDSAVPPFFVTEFVSGDAYEPIFDGPGRCSDVTIRARILHAASLLALLHGLDARALGVALDAPTTPADEVQRWVAAFASVPDELAGDAAELGRALGDRPPDPAQPTLTHGDYRLGNMIAQGGAVRAILDWEIWSFADPRLDLAWFVAQADAGSHPLTVWQPPGMPGPEALVAAYEEARGVVVGDLSWFAALVRFKVAATSALIAKHDRSGAERDPSRSKWEPGIPVLISDGLRILEAAR